MGWTVECTADVVLLLAQIWQSLHISAIWEPIFFHTNLAKIIRLLALMPGWAMLWMELAEDGAPPQTCGEVLNVGKRVGIRCCSQVQAAIIAAGLP